MKKILPFIFTIAFLQISFAQPDITFLDNAGYFKISAGAVMPGPQFSDATSNGLFAKNGYQIGFDLNYMIAYGFGIGGNFEFNSFGFNKDQFFSLTQAQTMVVRKRYNSSKFGLNVLFNMPVKLGSDDWVLNFYAEGNAGFRSLSIPEIDLTYHELANKYVQVEYRPRANTMGYLGYSGGLQFIFLEKYGINISYNALLRSRHSIKYSVRMFDAEGMLYEEENYLHDYLDHTGIQVGFMFIFGK